VAKYAFDDYRGQKRAILDTKIIKPENQSSGVLLQKPTSLRK